MELFLIYITVQHSDYWIYFAIVFAVGGTNRINLRNYARSYFCWLLITVVLVIILLIVGFAIAGTVYNIFDHSGYYHYYM